MQNTRYKVQRSDPQTILIVSCSGQMLAQAARRAGLTPVVIDLFGDSDTCELAAETLVVDTLRVSALADALDSLSERYTWFGAVYGSGLENHPESLEYLYKRIPVFGNTPDTFRRLHDKRDFFTALKRLELSYPETLFAPPETPGIWLSKPYRGQGGSDIHFIDPGPVEVAPHDEGNVYWQHYQPGEPLSALFLADGAKTQIIGFNRQSTAAVGSSPFTFSGVSNNADLPAAEQRRLDAQLLLLTEEFSLLGLNSLDFIWDGQKTWILEINSRPPASLALYDACFRDGLLAAHIAACRKSMPALECLDRSDAAYRIVFAPCNCRVPADIKWPDWAADRPQPGTSIRAGQPICSIMARCKGAQQMSDLLRTREHFIFNLIRANDEHAIHSKR